MIECFHEVLVLRTSKYAGVRSFASSVEEDKRWLECAGGTELSDAALMT
jgi:hypothetical protein